MGDQGQGAVSTEEANRARLRWPLLPSDAGEPAAVTLAAPSPCSGTKPSCTESPLPCLSFLGWEVPSVAWDSSRSPHGEPRGLGSEPFLPLCDNLGASSK